MCSAVLPVSGRSRLDTRLYVLRRLDRRVCEVSEAEAEAEAKART